LRFGASFAILLAAVVLLTLAAGEQGFADPLKAASKQRIGNYDVEMTTEPKNPTAGASATDIMIRIAGVNGDDLVDVPIMMRLTKDGVELQRTNPIIVPYGHYAQEFTFTQAGRYVLYVDLNDYSYSGETLTFTFFINVASSSDYLYIAAPIVAVVAVAIVSMTIFMKGKNKKKREQKAGGRTEL
jgi:hypothetical protein